MASVFEGLEVGPAIEVFALNKACNEDKSPVKVNLGVGGMNFYAIFTICYDFLLLEWINCKRSQTKQHIFAILLGTQRESSRIYVAFV